MRQNGTTRRARWGTPLLDEQLDEWSPCPLPCCTGRLRWHYRSTTPFAGRPPFARFLVCTHCRGAVDLSPHGTQPHLEPPTAQPVVPSPA